MLILLSCLMTAGCSVFRNQRSVVNPEQKELTGNELIKKLVENNLSGKNFYIRKADIEIKRGKEKQKLLISWKCKTDGKSLISIRTRAGLEVSRIFLSNDTLIINDRINRILYFGKPDYIRREYGIPQELLPVVFGDYVKGAGPSGSDLRCNGGIVSMVASIKGIKTEYIVNCRREKITGADLYDGKGRKAIEIRYWDFVRISELTLASRILMKYYDMDAEISIKVEKIEYPWDGKIVFIPGKGYEKKELRGII